MKKVGVIKGTAINNDEKLLIYLESSDHLKIGQKIRVRGESEPFERAGNPGAFDASSYYHNKGYAYIVFADEIEAEDNSCDRLREALRRFSDRMCGIYEEIFEEGDADIMSAIVLGRREKVTEDEIYPYKQGGCMHLFAVSGLHVSMIAGIFLWLAKKLPIGFKAGRFSVLILLVLYGMLAGFSISCARAVIMIAASIAARLCGRKYDMPSAMALAGTAILLASPKELFSAGFLLSFGTVAAINLACPRIVKRTGAKKLEPLITAVAASASTLPVVLYYYNDAPMYSALINIVVIPIMGLLFVVGIACLAAGLIYMPAAGFLSASAHYILSFYEKICRLGSDGLYGFRLKGHPGLWNIAAYYLIFALVLFVIGMNKKKLSNCVICILSLIPLTAVLAYRPPRQPLNVTMIDVGQGDGICIETPGGASVMVDGGSSDEDSLSKYTLEPFFNYMGISVIDAWFITHMDADHYNGLAQLLARSDINRVSIGTLVLPDIKEKETEFAELLRYEDRFDSVYFMGRGDVIRIGGVAFTCFSPERDGRLYDDANGYSLVFGMNYKDFDMLFTGDAGMETEKEILKMLPGFDVLKVAHHGSASSSCDEFLHKINAGVALISAGRKNPYGHPDEEVLGRLKDAGAQCYITIDSGAVTVSTDGSSISCGRYKDGG